MYANAFFSYFFFFSFSVAFVAHVICYANHFVVWFLCRLVSILRVVDASPSCNGRSCYHCTPNCICGRNLRKKFIIKQIYANKQKHTKVLAPIICDTSFVRSFCETFDSHRHHALMMRENVN